MTGPQRREQLLGVARTLFAAKGYEATTVEDIADGAGVTRPVVYEHFGGKQGIYAVVVDREVTALSEAIGQALQGSVRPRAAAELAGQALLRYIEQDAEGFRILARDAPVGSGRGSFASVLVDVAEHAEALLVRTFEASGMPVEHAPIYARMLVGAFALLGEWWLDTQEHSREVVAAHAVNLLWNGLGGLEAEPTLRFASPGDDG